MGLMTRRGSRAKLPFSQSRVSETRPNAKESDGAAVRCHLLQLDTQPVVRCFKRPDVLGRSTEHATLLCVLLRLLSLRLLYQVRLNTNPLLQDPIFTQSVKLFLCFTARAWSS